MSLALGLIAGLGAAVAVPPAALATAPKGAFRGEAYGTWATAVVGPVAAGLGKAAYLSCPCQGTNGRVRTNTVNGLAVGTLGAVLRADAVTTTVVARRTSTAAEVANSSTVTGLNALGGLIAATTLKAVASTSATGSATTGNPNGSPFVNLVVNGRAVAANPASNSRIEVPNRGTVVLNRQVVVGAGKPVQTITVEALAIEVKVANRFGLPVGAKIVIARAVSDFSRTDLATFVGGHACAALANAKVGSA